MKPIKYSPSEATKIDLGTKVILKYPSPTKKYDVGHMTVNGRFPQDGSFSLNKVCDFFVYILSGKGIIYVGEVVFTVTPKDVVFVPKQNNYAMEGNFEYLTIDIPAYYPEQAEEISKLK